MPEIKLLGLAISVYTRIARLALEEKNIDYVLQEVDIFADAGPPREYLELNPFGTIPCLLHGDLVIYETSAINRYVDEISPAISLQPSPPEQQARMNQIISILDNYCYRPMVWDVYVQRVVVPSGGGLADEASIAAALTLQQPRQPRERPQPTAEQPVSASTRQLGGAAAADDPARRSGAAVACNNVWM